jgi:hypothetical protein
LLSIGLTLYYFQAWIKGRNLKYFFCFLIGFIGTLVFRIQFFMVLVPFLLAWGLTLSYLWRPWKVFTTVFILSVVFFFGSSLVSQEFNLPSLVVHKQHEFLELKGNTRFALNRLEPTINSFATTLPQATINLFFRPYPWEAKGPMQLAAVAEIVFFWIVILWGLRSITLINSIPLAWFVLYFGICTYLLIGYTVPFPGAFVRYKIIPELLFFLLFLPLLPVKLKKMNI